MALTVCSLTGGKKKKIQDFVLLFLHSHLMDELKTYSSVYSLGEEMLYYCISFFENSTLSLN